MSNMDWKEVEAASVEEATREALEQLGAREDEVTIEVIATPRAGVLGLGARQARVRVTRKGAEGVGANPPAVSQASQAPRERNEGASDGRGRGRENQRRGRDDGRARNQSPAASAGGADDDSGAAGRKNANLEEQRREAMVILKQILEQMGEPTEVRQIEVDCGDGRDRDQGRRIGDSDRTAWADARRARVPGESDPGASNQGRGPDFTRDRIVSRATPPAIASDGAVDGREGQARA